MIAKLTKRFILVFFLFAVVLVLLIFAGILLADYSANIIPVLNQIEFWSRWHLFGVRLVVYGLLLVALPYWIQYRRPDTNPNTIKRARLLVIKVLVIYELLFGINIVGVLLS